VPLRGLASAGRSRYERPLFDSLRRTNMQVHVGSIPNGDAEGAGRICIDDPYVVRPAGEGTGTCAMISLNLLPFETRKSAGLVQLMLSRLCQALFRGRWGCGDGRRRIHAFVYSTICPGFSSIMPRKIYPLLRPPSPPVPRGMIWLNFGDEIHAVPPTQEEDLFPCVHGDDVYPMTLVGLDNEFLCCATIWMGLARQSRWDEAAA